MLKIFKCVIRPNEGTEVYQRDSKHRVTMGYSDGTIHVKIDEVIAPNPNLDEELPEDTPTVLRDVQTTADFVTIAEKSFTEQDFVKLTDNNKWIVEYNSDTKTISDPIDVYEISKQYINGSNSHEKIYFNLNKYRYENDASRTPLFVVDSYFKSLGFEASTLQFFVEDLQVNLLDTILEVPNDEVVETTTKEYEFWCNYNVRNAVTFEVYDQDGKILTSPYPSVKASVKAANFVTLEQKAPVNLTGINPDLDIEQVDFSGNRYYAVLPASDSHQIRVMFGNRIHNLINQRPYATFDVETINGVSNKTRLTSEYDPQNPNTYVQEFVSNHNHPADKMAKGFSGVEGILVNTSGLISGDFFKLKLNLGKFVSWAELWIQIE